VYGAWESTRKLRIDYGDAGLSDWLQFQHYERKSYGKNTIRVFVDESVLIAKEKRMPRIVIRDCGGSIRGGELYVRGEIQVSGVCVL